MAHPDDNDPTGSTNNNNNNYYSTTIHSVIDICNEEEDDDDDSVEFIGTSYSTTGTNNRINNSNRNDLPRHLYEQQRHDDDDENDYDPYNDELVSTTTTTATTIHHEKKNDGHDHQRETTTTPTTHDNSDMNDDTTRTKYNDTTTTEAATCSPYRDSIYVQNLAEICWTMLHDRRWRILQCAESPHPRRQRQPIRPTRKRARNNNNNTHDSSNCQSRTTTNNNTDTNMVDTRHSMTIHHNTVNDNTDNDMFPTTTTTATKDDPTITTTTTNNSSSSSCSCSIRPDAHCHDDVIRNRTEPAPNYHHPSLLLFQWENGDDCKSIIALSRLYNKNNNDNATPTNNINDHSTQTNNNNHQINNNTHQSQPTHHPDVVGSSSSLSSLSNMNRRMHLYCRLFYRKGPWFRIDDIYQKYYQRDNNDTVSGISDDSPTPNGSHMQRRRQSCNSDEQQLHSTTTASVDVDNVESEKNGQLDGSFASSVLFQPVQQMIQDLYDLYSAGYIRFFDTEMECGQTIGGGGITSSGSGRLSSVLTVDEQQIILSKIGGGTKKGTASRRRTASSNNHNNSNRDSTTTNITTTHRTKVMNATATTSTINVQQQRQARPMNRIWQQMRQQPSILTSFGISKRTTATTNTNSSSHPNGNNHKKVLPVRNHVETLLITKLVQLLASQSKPPPKITNSSGQSTQQQQQQQQPLPVATTDFLSCSGRRASYVDNSNSCSSKNAITSTTQSTVRINQHNIIHQYIEQLIQQVFAQHQGDDDHIRYTTDTMTTSDNNNIYVTCFRLCELPLLTLRRCVRLYLCATSGPGVMRSTTNNGYRTCRRRRCICDSTTNPPSNNGCNNRALSATHSTSFALEPPPSWHLVQYPSMSYCFGLTSAPYYNAYHPLPVRDNNGTSNSTKYSIYKGSVQHHHSSQRLVGFPPSEQVFPTSIDFHRWEMYVEVRCMVDYVLELNDQYRSEERKRQKVTIQKQQQREQQQEAANESSERCPTPTCVHIPIHTITPTSTGGSADCLSVLASSGRKVLIQQFVPQPNVSLLCEAVELAVIDPQLSNLVGEYEQILGIIGILSIYIMSHHHEQHCNNNMSTQMQHRPWLRHMSWLAGLALIVSDIIPVFERRGLHFFAIQSLQVLLYGSFLVVLPEMTLDRTILMEHLLQQQHSFSHPSWISRRARGKAIVRLVIDCCQIPLIGYVDDVQSEKAASKAKNSSMNTFRKSMDRFCQEFIANAAASGAIGFSSIRTIARRLKLPLEQTLNPFHCIESKELGIRFNNPACNAVTCNMDKSGYTDWTPVTDYFVANSINRDNNEPGTRCTFVGFEDEINQSILSRSLNVEELALDLYRTGRLPNCIDSKTSGTVKGGWTGWHNEGGTVRTLFRVICGGPLLHMDFENVTRVTSETDTGILDSATTHLSPYQQGPFHLLVGYELRNVKVDANDIGRFYTPTPSFYCQYADTISQFLSKLAVINGQELCDVVYDAVASRLRHVCTNKLKDPFLELDLIQVRTLSAIAVGFGGRCLAAMFRCLLFDYRHYSGGLPDLHLFRAMCTYLSAENPDTTLVDLGDWIGESFSIEKQQSHEYQRVLHIMADDEFLGLDKPNNSRQARNKTSPPQAHEISIRTNRYNWEMLPERLQLIHNGCAVQVECMMVEVKSSNDRLDPRQEDWLNIIDIYGNARVCKFVGNENIRKNKSSM